MERLLEDAEKLSGQKYEMGNFADLIDAIGVINDKFNITGKTAQEAATTIEGSVNSMKSSWENLKVAIGTGEGIEEATQNFADSFTVVAKNIIPVVEQMLPALGKALGTAVGSIDIPSVVATIGNITWELGTGVVEGLGEAIVGELAGLGGWLNDHIKVDGVALGDWFKFGHDPAQWESLATDMQSGIIQALADNGSNWMEIPKEFREGLYDKLIDSFQRGDFDSVNQYLADAMSETDSPVRFKINAEGELEVTNTRDIKLEALSKFKETLDSGADLETQVEAGVDFIVKAKEDGHTTQQIRDYIEGMEMPDDVKKELLLQLETKLDRGGGGGSFGQAEQEVEQAVEELSKPEEVNKTLTANVSANVNTQQAKAHITSAVNGIKQVFGKGDKLGKKSMSGTIAADVNHSSALSTISGAISKIKSAFFAGSNSLGSRTFTGTMSATITTTIKNVFQKIQDFATGGGGKKSPRSALSNVSTGLLGDSNGGTANGNTDIFQTDVNSSNLALLIEDFAKLGRSLMTALSNGFNRASNLFINSFNSLLSRLNEDAKKNADELAHVYDGLSDKYKYLDENAEKWQKRLAEIQVEENKAKLGTGKTVLENEKLQIAYEQSQDALFKLSDEYKNYEKALEDAKKKEEELKQESEDLKRQQEQMVNIQKDVNKAYESYLEKVENSYSKGTLDIQDTYKQQKAQVKAMEQLPGVLNSLLEKGMPVEFIQQLLNLDPETALEVAKKYLKMGDKAFAKQMDLWTRGTTARQNLSALASDVNGDADKMYNEILEKLKDLPDALKDALLQTMKIDEFKRLGFDDNQVHLDFRLTWDTMTTNDLARLLAPMITAEQNREK